MLRTLNPSPYLFLLDFPDFQAIGSSPEVMVKSEFVKEDNNFLAYLRPIAGTYRRGATPKDDEELIKKLKEDPKELAEHLMLIDLARNDLGRVAIPGTVRLTDLMIVERYSHVLHLVSEIVANLDKKIDPIDLLKAVFPAGTLSGAPKVKAMQIISELEPTARGLYAGAIGYIGFDNTINMAMTIRTLIMKDQTIHLQVGAGIVHDSDPEKEFQETINKGAALLKVVEGAIILSSKN
jgi:anthranilate synthase component 1